jgi:Sodium/calcium exchanger protein
MTSAKRVIRARDSEGQMVDITVLVWNDSVANLLLLGLGSSAPQIMLVVIDTLTTLGQPAGTLGPASVVGAFAYFLYIKQGSSELEFVAVCLHSRYNPDCRQAPHRGAACAHWTRKTALKKKLVSS